MAVSQFQTFDALLELEDGGAAITADAAGQVSSSDQILDVGGDGKPDSADREREAELHGNMQVDISAIAIDGNDELYHIILQGSSKADFASDIENLAILSLGALEVALGGSDIDGLIGRYVVPFTNERNGITFRFLRLFVDVTGATVSITLKARLHKQD